MCQSRRVALRERELYSFRIIRILPVLANLSTFEG